MLSRPAPSAAPVLHRIRYESFGGIVSSIDPPFLAWVDREFMRGLGFSGSPLWEQPADSDQLSAPTEVHFAVTNRCSRGCSGCYKDSQNEPYGDLPLDDVKEILRTLSDRGVFHVALGGGEALERQDFREIVEWCRSVGLVPNLTTSGVPMTGREIEICRLMGQVNISCDAVGGRYGINGRKGSFEDAVAALRSLKKAGVAAGINCVVSRKNFADLPEVIRFAAKESLHEIEFLKFKPSGRGRNCYTEYALTQDMIRQFYPAVMKIGRPASLELKIDCSFIPALLWHRPPPDQLELCGVNGCEGGNLLLSVGSNGIFSGCSFVENPGSEPVTQIETLWQESKHLRRFRNCAAIFAEPCRGCAYKSICKGGCRAVSLFVQGDFDAPDPECPFVVEYGKEHHA